LQYIFNFAPTKLKISVYKIDNVEEFAQLLGKSKNIVLVGHVNPDGDSIGSLMGMKGYLCGIGRDVVPVVPNPYPEFLKFLDLQGEVLAYSELPEQVESAVAGADLIICLDFNSLKRIDALGDVIAAAGAPKVLIDHHPQPDAIFNIVYSYPELSSTCEVVYWFLNGLIPIMGGSVGMKSALPLYTGMMTDTNNFSNSVLPSTFRMAAGLMDIGVDKEWVQKMVFGGYSESRMRLMGHMLVENMKIIPQYNASVMVLTRAMKERFNFTDGDSEGFVNLALNIKDVKVSGFFTEGEEFIRVSLRSKDDFSVNRLARGYFNGGGHERAAGGRLYIPVGEVEEYFIKSLGEFIEKEK
jgi:phosphoesterase RecJ-like protein